MYTIQELLEGYKKSRFSPVEIATEYVNRSKQNQLNAYITITEDIALAQAKIAEERWLSGNARPLKGIPLSYKDNIYAKDVPATSGSKIDRKFFPDKDATVVKNLHREGAVMIGKTNLHEFAFGITNNNPFYGPAKNPWNQKLIPGGSSGGSAVSVAAHLAAASIGTDTGGSVRIPASICGLVGLKPTKNLIDASGTTLISWTLDHIGPIANNVGDLSLVIEALTKGEVTLTTATNLYGLKVGIPTNFFTEQIEPEVLSFYEEAVDKLQKLGAELKEMEVPGTNEAMSLTFTMAIAEAGYVHKERIEEKLGEYGDDVKQVMESSKSIPAKAYIKALKRRDELSQLFEDSFRDIDVLFTPTLPAESKPIGQEVVVIDGKEEPIFDCMNRFTNYFNVTGNPALTLPAGISSNGLPIGIQLIAKKGNDSLLLKTAKTFETAYLDEFYEKRAEVLGGVVES